MRIGPTLSLAGSLTLVLAMGTASVRADVIPSDYQVPPPPQCVSGARLEPNRGRGHSPWLGCVATTCTTDADCGALGPCREAALCVGPEVGGSGPLERGEEPRRYRLAPLACDAQGTCPSPYECRTELRCVGTPPPPPAPPSAPPPARESERREPTRAWGLCSVRVAGRSAGPFAVLALAALGAAWRRRAR